MIQIKSFFSLNQFWEINNTYLLLCGFFFSPKQTSQFAAFSCVFPENAGGCSAGSADVKHLLKAFGVTKVKMKLLLQTG